LQVSLTDVYVMQAKNRGKKPVPPPKSASMDEEAMPMFTKLTAVKP